MVAPDPAVPTPVSQVPTAPLAAPEDKLQPGWSIGVFPYKVKNGKVVAWNSVVRQKTPSNPRGQVKVLTALASPELARENAMNFLRSRGLLG